MNKLILITLLCVTGCTNRQVEPVCKREYYKFMTYASSKNVSIDSYRNDNLIVMFADLRMPTTKGIVVGLCTIGAVGKNGSIAYQVKLDTKFWDESDDYTRESLLYHELGHCLLGRKHREEVDLHGQPVSLMNPMIVKSPIFNASDVIREGYISELFTRIDGSESVLSEECTSIKETR